MNAIRVARATDQDTKSVGDADDQNGAESSAKSSALDELTLDSEGNDEDRNKRLVAAPSWISSNAKTLSF